MSGGGGGGGHLFSLTRMILLYSLFLQVLLDVTLENRLLSLFWCGSNDHDVNFDTSKCVTLVCIHTNIALIEADTA